MTLIAKNVSVSVQTFLGAVLPAAEQIDLTNQYTQQEIANSSELNALILSGDIVMNDGTSDLTPAEAVEAIAVVESVQGKSGVVEIDPDDLDDAATTNKFTDQASIDKLTGIEELADVTDSINVEAAGAVMETDTDTSLMQFVIDEDSFNTDSDTKVPTQQSTKAFVETYTAALVLAEKSYQGGYDANLNLPDLVTPAAEIVSKGDVYDVITVGTFFGEDLQIGDTLRAKVDDPSSLADWVIVQMNLTPASIKTQYESNPNTNEFDDTEKAKLGGIEDNATADQTGAEIKGSLFAEADTNNFDDAAQTKLNNVEALAEVNNISDIDVTDLTDAGESSLHYHDSDRARANHTGTQVAATISDFDAEVSSNAAVAANTSHASNTSNPHSVTKTQVGLSNVPNVDATDRANHTGTQTASTISDFDTEVGNHPDVSANTTHRSSDGSEHAFIDQSVISGSSPTLNGANISGVNKTVFSQKNIGVTSDPSTTANSSGTAPTLAEMTHTFTPAKATNKIKVHFGSIFDQDGGGGAMSCSCAVFVDGVLQPESHRKVYVDNNDSDDGFLEIYWDGELSVASHTIDIRFWTTNNSVEAIGINRSFYIEEIEQAA